MKEKYKKSFNKINLLASKKEEIYENITRKKVSRNYWKPMIVTSFLLFLLGVGAFCMVYAKERKNKLNFSTITKVENKEQKEFQFFSSSVAKIKEDVNIPEIKYDVHKNPTYTYDELETIFGIPFLKSTYFGLENIIPEKIIKNKGKIAEASFSVDNFFNNYLFGDTTKTNRHTFHFSFLTKYASKKYLYNSYKGKGECYEYYINALDTKAFVVNSNSDFIQSKLVYFDYKNIHYWLYLHFVGKQKEEAEEEMIRILESFYL